MNRVLFLLIVGLSGLGVGCVDVAPEDLYSGPAEPSDDGPLPSVGPLSASEPVAGWEWVDVPGTVCRNQTSTGVAVQRPQNNPGTVDPNKLVVFLSGGNACLNAGCFETINRSHFNEGDWNAFLGAQLADVETDAAGNELPRRWDNDDDTWLGVLDGHPDNPFADWTKVYVPYCSGDWHAGTNEVPTRIGNGSSVFRGADNMERFLSAIVSLVGDDKEQVVVTGASAGGIGAFLNFHRFADVYGAERTYLISDGGPLYVDEYAAACFQDRLKNLWRMDRAFPVLNGCPGDACVWNDASWINRRLRWLFDTAGRGRVEDGPERAEGSRMALVVSDKDRTSAGVFDMMANECQRLRNPALNFTPPLAITEAATLETRDELFDPYHGIKAFLVDDTTHMWMVRSPWWRLRFTEVDTDGDGVDDGGTRVVSLAEWVAQMLDEDPAWDHVRVQPTVAGAVAPSSQDVLDSVIDEGQ